MNRLDPEKIETLMSEIDCKKGFQCKESDFSCLCKARDVGLENFIVEHEKVRWDSDVRSI
jgi:hypothetical protein